MMSPDENCHPAPVPFLNDLNLTTVKPGARIKICICHILKCYT